MDLKKCVMFEQVEAHEDDVNAVAFADEGSQILFSGSDDGLCKVCMQQDASANSTHQEYIQGLLHVPFAHTSTTHSLAFSMVGPLVWYGLPLALQSLSRVFSQKFLLQLKTTLFGRAGAGSASE